MDKIYKKRRFLDATSPIAYIPFAQKAYFLYLLAHFYIYAYFSAIKGDFRRKICKFKPKTISQVAAKKAPLCKGSRTRRGLRDCFQVALGFTIPLSFSLKMPPPFAQGRRFMACHHTRRGLLATFLSDCEDVVFFSLP